MHAKLILLTVAAVALCTSRGSAQEAGTSHYFHPLSIWEQPRPHRGIRADTRPPQREPLIIAGIAFLNTSLLESVALLQQASVDADATSHRGVRLHVADGLTESKANARVCLTCHDMDVFDIVQDLAQRFDCRAIVAQNDIVFVAK